MKYSYEADAAVESAKACGSSLRAHYKHCREVTHAIKGLKLGRAKSYLEDVLQFKQAIPFTKYTGGVGRHAQAKQLKAPGDKVRWPQKATKIVLDLLKNAEANAEMKGLDTENLYVKHTQANQAPKQRRRTYRAHGRINPYMCSPAHIEIILTNEATPVKKSADADGKLKITSRKAQQLKKIKQGGGIKQIKQGGGI